MSADLVVQSQLHRLYENHHAWLQNWLNVRLSNPMDAEDLAQDTFVRLIRSPQKLQELQEPRSFLVTVARGLTIDLFRRRSLERQYLEALEQLPPSQWPSEEYSALLIEKLMALDAMLSGLGDKVRQAFLYYHFDGLTYAQIADLLGVSLRTVKNYMARALEHCCLYRLQMDHE